MAVTVHEDMDGIEKEPARPKMAESKGILKQNREFLDFFWDIAKPERDIRLKAIEGLIEYLKKTEKPEELKYSLKRLVDGLSHTREDARTGYSLALAQLLSVFEDIQLQAILDQIKEKNSLQSLQKKQIRNVAFGNFFGVLALSQSTRLSKEPQVLLACVQLLQRLSQFPEHLRDLPRKTIVELLSETSEEVFEEVLLGALQSDLTSALSTPEHLELLLVAMQKFPEVLKPKRLKKILGSATVITVENVPKLLHVLKTAARSVKKERLLPRVAVDLLEVSLREDSFDLFWSDIILNGLMKDQPGPSHYMCFRLVGSALPLLSTPQIREVLSSDVMRHYGEHVVVAQQPDRFKIAPEMDVYVRDFLQGCDDPDKQLAAMVGFTQLTNQGYPIIPSFWKVVEVLQPAALERYVDWLKTSFLRPELDTFLDFSTRRQRENQAITGKNDDVVLRLRKWILPRLTSIIENHQVKKEEDLVMDVARFIFFHAYFTTKKSTSDIPETERSPSMPFDEKTRSALMSSFISVLHHLNHLPVQGETKDEDAPKRQLHGLMADGSSWLYCLVHYADMLLSQTKYVECSQPFTAEQRSAWDSMMKSIESLQKKAKKSQTPETSAFQLLFLLVGINLFKAPEESVDLIKDIQSCMEKVNARKSKRKKKADANGEEEEPDWVEVLVEIILSLLSQPSRLIRQVCKTVFGRICAHINQGALTAILDVLDPNKASEDGAVVVTDDVGTEKGKKGENESDEDEEDDEQEDDDDDDDEDEESGKKKTKVKAVNDGDAEGEEGSDSSDDDDDLDEDLNDNEEVDPNFRLELMKVLQGQNALATEAEQSDEEELDDEAMMKLDASIADLFAQQKKRLQAKKDERDKLRKEKALIRDFKIKVLDLVEVFLDKQSANPLVLGMIEPLLNIIENSMNSDREQQEIDYLRRAADIFKNTLCRGKQYCKNVDDHQADLHDLLERLITRAQKLSDSSVALYYFSAALYLVKVLRGVPVEKEAGEDKGKAMGNLDVERVTSLFRHALTAFMTRRKCPLTGAMFIDLFNRLPAFSCSLLDTVVEHITKGVREHQQGQACAMMLRGLQSKEIQQLLAGPQWTEMCQTTLMKLTESFGQGLEVKNKIIQEKVIKALELSLFLIKNIKNHKLDVNLEPLEGALRSLSEQHDFHKSGHMEDIYWSVMKHFGVQKPKMAKMKRKAEEEVTPEQTQEAEVKKKKGFLPETKKRKNRKKPAVEEGKEVPPQQSKPSEEATGEGEQGKKKKKNRNRKKNKKRKLAEGEETSAGQSPAKKQKTMDEPPAKKGKINQLPTKNGKSMDQSPVAKDKKKPKKKKNKGKKGVTE